MQQSNNEMEEAKLNDKPYISFLYSNGDTRKELLIRSRYLLFKSANNQTEQQKERLQYYLKNIPILKKLTTGLCHSLRMIFSKNMIKDTAKISITRRYNKVEEAGLHSFNVIAATFYEQYDKILNFYNNCSSNALMESFNAKIVGILILPISYE